MSLSGVKIPVMGIYGGKDIIVNPQQWQVLQEFIPNTKIEWFPKAGHFIMLDEPHLCLEKIKDFLDAKSEQPV
jgi:pimeloyl-ACP methyl ester carboxylesterase